MARELELDCFIIVAMVAVIYSFVAVIFSMIYSCVIDTGYFDEAIQARNRALADIVDEN